MNCNRCPLFSSPRHAEFVFQVHALTWTLNPLRKALLSSQLKRKGNQLFPHWSMWSTSSCFISLLWLCYHSGCSHEYLESFFFLMHCHSWLWPLMENGLLWSVRLCYVMLLLITHYDPQVTGELWSLCMWGRAGRGSVESCLYSRRTGLSWLPHTGPRPTYWYD